jgi:phosphoglycerate kinase
MQTIDNFNFAGKKAFVRVDFNVPLDENFNITDDTRIRAALPTLKKILADGGSIIIGSHLGRPKGVADKFSLKHIVSMYQSYWALKFSLPTTVWAKKLL